MGIALRGAELINEVKEKILRISEELVSEEHVAGRRDEEEAERIISVLEKFGAKTFRKIRFPLISWRLKDVELEPSGKVSLAPYVEDFDVEARPFFLEGDPSEPKSWRGFPEGSIAVAKEPENPDELKAATLLAAEAGAKALTVFNEKNVLRKIVTTGTWGFSFHAGSPTPIPVLFVDKEFVRRVKSSSTIRIFVSARSIRTSGIILEADEGEIEGRPIFGAHYDRWFKGFQDDILGIAQAFLAWKGSVKKFGGGRLLLFSAEEHGTLGYAGWYWAWGSRWYVKQLLPSLIEGLGPYVNFDIAGSSPLKVSGSPQLICNIIEEDVEERCCECPECDSFSFATQGFETLSFHSLWNEKVREIYHTELDVKENANMEEASRAVLLSLKALEGKERWNCFSKRLKEWLGSSGILGRRALVVIESLAKRVGWKKVYSELSRRFLKAINYGDYRWSTGDLEAVWFPEAVIYRRILRDIERGERPPLEVWVSGEERLLYTFWADPKRSGVREMLSEQAYENLKNLNEIVNEISHELLA